MAAAGAHDPRHSTLRLPIVGIREELSLFWALGPGRGNAIITPDLGQQLPSMGFDNVREFYRRGWPAPG